jgi:hypothetical protein
MFNIVGRNFNIDVECLTYAGLTFWNELHEALRKEELKTKGK